MCRNFMHHYLEKYTSSYNPNYQSFTKVVLSYYNEAPLSTNGRLTLGNFKVHIQALLIINFFSGNFDIGILSDAFFWKVSRNHGLRIFIYSLYQILFGKLAKSVAPSTLTLRWYWSIMSFYQYEFSYFFRLLTISLNRQNWKHIRWFHPLQ
jgi:hypothetical protein